MPNAAEHLYRIVLPVGESFVNAESEEQALKRAHFGMGIPVNMIVRLEQVS